MPRNEIAIPEGRGVSAPETPGGSHSSKTVGAITVRLVAPSLHATVIVNPQAPAAYAVISGDKNDEVSIAWEHGYWTLRWPGDAGRTTIHGMRVGNVQVNYFSGGSVYVNGVRMDQMAGLGGVKEQPAVHLILPSGCSLHAELQSGEVEVPPTADERHGVTLVSLSSQSAGLYAGCAIGEITLGTQSGDLRADSFTGQVNANTMSGDISLARAAGNVQAKTMSGDVRVTAADGVTPSGSGSSKSGEVSLPPSMGGGGRRRS